MKISIALATYNGTAYLAEQLNSYLCQERQPDELVVSDDASVDDTIDILNSFSESAPFVVRVVQNKINMGYTKNFEKALTLCTGDIVLFSDQDDVWFPNKIAVIERLFIEHREKSLLIHDGELVSENLAGTGVTKQGQIKRGGYSNDAIVTGALTAVSRVFLDIALPFPEGISGGHDGWVHKVAGILGRRLLVSDVLQKLRRHDSNTSEWVASSVKKIGKVDVFTSQLSTAPALSYADRLLYNKSLIQLIGKMKAGHSLRPQSLDYDDIRAKLESEKRSLNRRNRLVSRGFLGRKLNAISMLIAGDYTHFNGYKSFFRDILR